MPDTQFILDQILPRSTVVGLGLTSIVLLVGLALEARRIASRLSRLAGRKALLALVAVLLTVGGLAAFLVPRSSYNLFDEPIYENIAQGVVATGEARMPSFASIRSGRYVVHEGGLNKEPGGYPFYLSIAYRIFGVHGNVSRAANNVALMLGAAAVFGLALLLSGSGWGALVSAWVYGSAPEALRWANTASPETASSAFGALAVFAAAWLATEGTVGSALFLAGAAGLAVQTRPEALLFLIPVFILLLSGARGAESKFRLASRSALVATGISVALLAILLVPHLLQLLLVRHQPWGATGPKFSWAHLVLNFRPNFLHYFDDGRFPAVYTLLALLGASAGHASRGHRLMAAAWFLAFWSVYAFFYAGSYEFGADVRYSILTLAPLAIFAGWGATRVGAFLRAGAAGRRAAQSARVALVAVLGLVGVAWGRHLPRLRVEEPMSWEARADQSFVAEAAKSLPRDSLVIGEVPAMWLLQGISSVSGRFIVGQGEDYRRRVIDSFPGGVYFHWDYWCLANPELECARRLEPYDLRLVSKSFEYQGKFYALYRIIGLKRK